MTFNCKKKVVILVREGSESQEKQLTSLMDDPSVFQTPKKILSAFSFWEKLQLDNFVSKSTDL